jgi:hypothetical protein
MLFKFTFGNTGVPLKGGGSGGTKSEDEEVDNAILVALNT